MSTELSAGGRIAACWGLASGHSNPWFPLVLKATAVSAWRPLAPCGALSMQSAWPKEQGDDLKDILGARTDVPPS